LQHRGSCARDKSVIRRGAGLRYVARAVSVQGLCDGRGQRPFQHRVVFAFVKRGRSHSDAMSPPPAFTNGIVSGARRGPDLTPK